MCRCLERPGLLAFGFHEGVSVMMSVLGTKLKSSGRAGCVFLITDPSLQPFYFNFWAGAHFVA